MQALVRPLEEESKLYEVRVFNKEGKLKRIISPKELIKTYWERFKLEKSWIKP